MPVPINTAVNGMYCLPLVSCIGFSLSAEGKFADSFLVTQWTGFPRSVQPQEHSEIRWFSINEALQLDLALPDYPDLFRTMERRHC